VSETIPYAGIESKWQERWEKEGLFAAPAKPRHGRKFYCLDMFPYPSADGLHVGHPEGYTATDILCRMKRMQGFDVLHPMGWDAFGLPAENFAIQTGAHPAEITRRNIANFKRQIRSLGFSYDWSREITTTDPGYYRFTQWIFIRLFEKGLAYESTAPINWCPSCKTGLANEEVFRGACERCGTSVERKSLRQWFLKITAYADRLEKDLDGLDWPSSTLAMQKNWIGRSEGAEISFPLEAGGNIRVFTTRPDTLFGATYIVLAPENPLAATLPTAERRAEVAEYVRAALSKSEMERGEPSRDKTGAFTGAFAIHPLTGRKLPVWVADYVLSGYGSGAVMAVPAHDERDFDFAKAFGLDIVWVVAPLSGELDRKSAFVDDGISVHSPPTEGLPSAEARRSIIEILSKKGLGRGTVQYRLRDWIFSRQRYWGEPIPIIHCSGCGAVPVPDKDLPVLLPAVKNYKPTGTGESPLAAIDDWVSTACPRCGKPARRETNTMPQWAGSCWYYLRFLDPRNADLPCSEEIERAWMPVDCYVGGAEHAVLHLLYARFWHKVLYDLKLVSTPEPFLKLRHQGMILSFSFRDDKGVYHPYDEVRYDAEGRATLENKDPLDSQIEKMSKSKKNVVNPDGVVKSHGADAFRLYEMFMGAFEESKPWDMRNIEGVSRFLRRIWTLIGDGTGAVPGPGLESLRHRTIKKVTEDIASFGFNTAISALMIYLNEIQAQEVPSQIDLETLLLLLHPFAPHMTEELWERSGHASCLAKEPWPSYDLRLIAQSRVEYAVQVNGKLRATIEIEAQATEKAVLDAALSLDKVRAILAGRPPLKTIVVPRRLVNIVVK
jgi:leucyl-tRNA synthetase